jgi:hypothetical protein
MSTSPGKPQNPGKILDFTKKARKSGMARNLSEDPEKTIQEMEDFIPGFGKDPGYLVI